MELVRPQHLNNQESHGNRICAICLICWFHLFSAVPYVLSLPLCFAICTILKFLAIHGQYQYPTLHRFDKHNFIHARTWDWLHWQQKRLYIVDGIQDTSTYPCPVHVLGWDADDVWNKLGCEKRFNYKYRK